MTPDNVVEVAEMLVFLVSNEVEINDTTLEDINSILTDTVALNDHSLNVSVEFTHLVGFTAILLFGSNCGSNLRFYDIFRPT